MVTTIMSKGDSAMKYSRMAIESARSIKHVHQSISEYDILELQELFLTYGLHSIKIPTMPFGRDLVVRFLDSLQCYSNVACLSLSTRPLRPGIVNLYDELALYGALAHSHTTLESFLLENFYYDFLWIEMSQELDESPWYWYLEQKLLDFNLIKTLPIVLLS